MLDQTEEQALDLKLIPGSVTCSIACNVWEDVAYVQVNVPLLNWSDAMNITFQTRVGLAVIAGYSAQLSAQVLLVSMVLPCVCVFSYIYIYVYRLNDLFIHRLHMRPTITM